MMKKITIVITAIIIAFLVVLTGCYGVAVGLMVGAHSDGGNHAAYEEHCKQHGYRLIYVEGEPKCVEIDSDEQSVPIKDNRPKER